MYFLNLKLKSFKYSQVPASYMMLSSRKAMSPLIATVLLIAFAVALGAMIMNWGTGGVVDSPVDIDAVCSDVTVQNNGIICYADGKLSFSVKNSGTSRIDGIRLKSATDIGNLELDVKDSSLISGEALTRDLPFLYGGGSIELSFLPVINSDGALVECGGYAISSLATCQS